MRRIGVLGFGEAGSTFAGALADAGAVVDSYDQITGSPNNGVKSCLLPSP